MYESPSAEPVFDLSLLGFCRNTAVLLCTISLKSNLNSSNASEQLKEKFQKKDRKMKRRNRESDLFLMKRRFCSSRDSDSLNNRNLFLFADTLRCDKLSLVDMSLGGFTYFLQVDHG